MGGGGGGGELPKWDTINLPLRVDTKPSYQRGTLRSTVSHLIDIEAPVTENILTQLSL